MDSPASRRALGIASIPSFQRISAFLNDSAYSRRHLLPGVCDFTLGNPHQMPQTAYVDALRDAVNPRDDQWFAYKSNGTHAREAAAESLQWHLDVP